MDQKDNDSEHATQIAKLHVDALLKFLKNDKI